MYWSRRNVFWRTKINFIPIGSYLCFITLVLKLLGLTVYVCVYGTHTNSHFWTDLNQTLHTSPPWSGRDRRVCMDPKFSTSSTYWALFLWEPLQNHGHKVAAGATVFRDTLISVIPASVRVTSPTWRCRRRRSHPRQPYISVILAGFPLTSWKWRIPGKAGYPC